MAESNTNVSVAEKLTDCLRRGDVEGVSALYAEDARIWRNFDNKELSKDKMLKVIGFLATKVKDLRYDVQHVHPTPSGFVQQHLMSCVSEDGTKVSVAACLVATLRDAKIVRLDEYLDSNALAPLMR